MTSSRRVTRPVMLSGVSTDRMLACAAPRRACGVTPGGAPQRSRPLAAWPRCARVFSAPGRPHGAQAGRGPVRRTHERLRLDIGQARAPADSGCEEGLGAGWAGSAP